MSKGGKVPKAPDLSKYAEASWESAKLWEQVARDQLEWAKTTDTANRALLQRTLDIQLPQMEQAFKNSQEDRARYQAVYQPVEDALIKDIEKVGSVENQEAEAAKRVADVRSQFESQRQNATRQLEDFGIDPSQTRYAALDLGLRAQEAATSAFAANAGRKQEEQLGRALRSEAINIGRGYPGQVAQSQAVVNQTAQGMTTGAGNMTNAGVNAYGSAAPYGQMAMSGYNQGANIQTQGFNNSMGAWDAKFKQDESLMSGIGSAAGVAATFMAEGGIPGVDGSPMPASTDTVPAVLSPNEFVIPEDVVRRKGTEFFDKLLERYKDGGDYEMAQRNAQLGAIPIGARGPQQPMGVPA